MPPPEGSLAREALKLMLQQPITVYSPHRLQDLLSHKSLASLSPSRVQEFQLLFIEHPQVTLQVSPPLNLASLLPISNQVDQPIHSCVEIVEALRKPREGLQDVPLEDPDLTFFMDRSSVKESNGVQRAAYVVVTLSQVIETNLLPSGTTSQKAKLVALTQALQLAAGKRATIYTDSKYAFLITHTHAAIWKERGFLTTKGTPIINGRAISRLLQALQDPKEVAIMHCEGHQTGNDLVTRGNALADTTAR